MTANLAEKLDWLREQATAGTWTVEAADEDACAIESDDKTASVAMHLDPNDAALIVALVNSLPAIIEALGRVERLEGVFTQLNERIAWGLCYLGPLNPDEIGANDGPNWKRYLPKAESITKGARAALSEPTT